MSQSFSIDRIRILGIGLELACTTAPEAYVGVFLNANDINLFLMILPHWASIAN